MSQQHNPYKQHTDAVSNRRLYLYGPWWKDTNSGPVFMIQTGSNTSSITVFTGIEGDTKPIRIGLDWQELLCFINSVEKVATGESAGPLGVVRTDPDQDGKVIASAKVGLVDGHVTIMVEADGRQKCPFTFRGNKWVTFLNEDGSLYTKSQISAAKAKSWVDCIKAAIEHDMTAGKVDDRQIAEHRKNMKEKRDATQAMAGHATSITL